MSLDFQDRLIDLIESSVELFAPIDVPVIKNDEGLSMTMSPIGRSSMDFSAEITREYGFSMAARSKSDLQAVNALYDINRFIDELEQGAVVSSNSSFIMNSIEVVSPPNLQAVSDAHYVYTCNFKAELTLTKN